MKDKEDQSMSISDIIDAMKAELKEEKKMIAFMERRELLIPPGSLEIRELSSGTYYVQRFPMDGSKKGIYLDPLNDEHRDVIKELMEKKTIVHGRPILEKNVKSMERCLKGLRQYHPTDHRFGELLGSEYYLEDDLCIKEWRKKPECMNPYKPELRIHETKKGILVRSKSEALIADMLFDLGIEFKYEPELWINGEVYYPDFEILHPTSLTLIWWEHLGRLHDPKYVYKNIGKVESYARGGIQQGRNLIITKETAELPLTRGMVEEQMNYYGLV